MYTEELHLSNVSEAICTGNWTTNALNELNLTIKYVEQGLAILKRYSPEEQRGLLAGGRLLVAAAIISRGGNESIHAPGRRAESLEERAKTIIPSLTEWAKTIGVWKEYSQENNLYLTCGGEAEVYDAGNGVVEKIIGLDYFIDPQLALDRIVIHNYLFPETNLHVIGFGTNSHGEFGIIVHQNIIRGSFTPQEEIDEFIDKLGLYKCSEGAHTFANNNLYLSDLHEENVLNVNHCRYYTIDGDFRLNIPEARIGGSRIIDDRIIKGNDISKRCNRGI